MKERWQLNRQEEVQDGAQREGDEEPGTHISVRSETEEVGTEAVSEL